MFRTFIYEVYDIFEENLIDQIYEVTRSAGKMSLVSTLKLIENEYYPMAKKLVKVARNIDNGYRCFNVGTMTDKTKEGITKARNESPILTEKYIWAADEIPLLLPSFDWVMLNDNDNEPFYNDHRGKYTPREEALIFNSRLFRIYGQMFRHIQRLTPCAMTVLECQARSDMNADIIESVLKKALEREVA